MAAGEVKWSVEKLDGSNWVTWRFQIKHVLLAKDLWNIVEGSERLPDNADEVAQSSFKSRQPEAFTTLVLALEPSQLYLVTTCESPEEAWQALRGHFERNTLANKLFLKKQLFRAEMKDHTSIQDHLKFMKGLVDRLHGLGCKISEEDQVVTLLGSLPKKYSTLVTALEAQVNDLSLDFVQEALVHEEMKHGSLLNTGQSESETALVGSSQSSKPKVVDCYNCGGPHYKRDCPALKTNKQRSRVHKAAVLKTKPADTHLSDSDSSGDGLFMCSDTAIEPVGDRSNWLVDSGASAHMVWNKKLISEYVDFKEQEEVTLGDGSKAKAIGSGKVCLTVDSGKRGTRKITLTNVLYVPGLACNFFSVPAVTDKGFQVLFGKALVDVLGSSGKVEAVGVRVGKPRNHVVGFADADWAGDTDDRKSMSGHVFIMSSGPVSWLSKKQPVVALSTCEAEYISLSGAAQEAIWLYGLLEDMQLQRGQPILVYEDNQGAIALAKNPVNHARTKHIDIQYHFIREAVNEGKIELKYCETQDMVADILTKPLARLQFEKLRALLGVRQLTK